MSGVIMFIFSLGFFLLLSLADSVCCGLVKLVSVYEIYILSVPWFSGSLCFSESFLKSCSLVDNICIYVSVRQEFLEPGEVIVMISKLKKLQKLTNRKVQLILTDKPKLLCMDPSKMTAEANIIWSHSPSELSVQVANSSHFEICTVCVFLQQAFAIFSIDFFSKF